MKELFSVSKIDILKEKLKTPPKATCYITRSFAINNLAHDS